MRATFRFLRTRSGATRFAETTVTSVESATWSVALGEPVQEHGAVHAEAIQDALALVCAEQDRRSGPRFSILVTDLVATAVDTTPDAVECSVSVAAWLSFGNDEQDMSVTFDGGRWRARFGASR